MCCHGPVPLPFTCHYHCGTDTLENQLCEILSRRAITNASIGEKKKHLMLVGKVFPTFFVLRERAASSEWEGLFQVSIYNISCIKSITSCFPPGPPPSNIVFNRPLGPNSMQVSGLFLEPSR